MTLGQHIQYLRAQRNITPDSLAKMLNISEDTITQWENDKAMPNAEQIIMMSHAFNVSADLLLGRPIETEPPKPVAKADILSDKKSIKEALSCRFSSTIAVMFGVSVIYILMSIFSVVINNLMADNSYYSTMISNYNYNNYTTILYFIYPAIPIIILAVFYFIRKSGIIKAQSFADGKSGSMIFFPDRMLLEIKGENAKVVQYSTLKRIFESDYYFAFVMPDNNVICVDKRKTAGLVESLSSVFNSYKIHLNKCVYKPDANRTISQPKLYGLKTIQLILFVLTLASHHTSLMIWGILILSNTADIKALLFIPLIIPVSALVYGIVLATKKIKTRKLLISAPIFIFYLTLYSCIISLLL